MRSSAENANRQGDVDLHFGQLPHWLGWRLGWLGWLTWLAILEKVKHSSYRAIFFRMFHFNPLQPNAPLTSKRYILYIYSINIGPEYFKYGIYSPFVSS